MDKQHFIFVFLILTCKDYRENIWDHAAGAIIVEEAGGKVTDMDGKALNFRDNEKMLDNRGVIATNGTIHEQVLQVLKDCGT